MKPLDKNSYLLLELNCKFVPMFLEICKPYLKDIDYKYYQRIIKDMDLTRNVYNISHYNEFVVSEIFKHCRF